MTLDVLAIGAHPDDVELGCGGTLASLSALGRRTGVMVLTRGERGSRGTPELRLAEARRGAAELGAEELVSLDCGDGGLRTGAAEEDGVIAELRRLRPNLVLGPPPRDRHPDHERAWALVRAACYYSGLVRRGEGEPWRPRLVLSYQLHEPFAPTLVVDVSAAWPRKVAALAAHRSQFPFAPGATVDRPAQEPARATWVSSREFWAAVEGRARLYGSLIGAAFGEAFLAHGPITVDDLALLRGGL